MNPTEIGYYEKVPGSGNWYKPGDKDARTIQQCIRCGIEFMARSGHPYCSQSCALRKDLNRFSYRTLHRHVQEAYGKASLHVCIDCGIAAEEWSQIHGTTGERAEHYEPRCRTCHRWYDRATLVRGERVSGSKLIESQVRAIKHARGMTQKQLADRYGVARSTIEDIRTGRTWQHVR